MQVREMPLRIASVVSLLVALSVLAWSIISVINGSHVEDLPKIAILALAGYSLVFLLDPIIARGSPYRRYYFRLTSWNNVVAGMIISLGKVFFLQGVFQVIAVVLSIVLGSVYDHIMGVDIFRFEAAGMFFLVLVWVAITFSLAFTWEKLCRHWSHLLEFWDMGRDDCSWYWGCEG